ncbi:putative E3 ubiquitin-protein ligase XBOS34 [Carex littledalei]|uniref:Putative E3 ubiquitin-protein ligase XBOS34 n=1 Tax=Carex littledalei TaxID=544730 RepID=A0A833QG36_9POAL|nr:putative E3 ubiquitin-protein ligase XBOS34 [Carex littledalei]
MDREIYEKVISGNIEDIRALRRKGAGIEWKDDEGKTPLIIACLRHDRFDVAKALIDFGADVNAYRPGKNGGTPLHHAIMKGNDQTVKLLLANGANPSVRNDDGDTALDLARKRGRFIIVRTIESHISIFSGWLRAECGSLLSGGFRPIPSDFRPGKVWAVVLPSDTIDLTRPLKLELVIYLAQEVAEPCEMIQLMENHIEQPNFNEPNPFVIIKTSGTRYKLFSEYWGEKQQIKLFYNACRGVLEANDLNTSLSRNQFPTTPLPTRHNTVPGSTHLANSAPEQLLVHRTIPVPTLLTNSASSPGVHRNAPISTGFTSAGATETYTTDPEDIELARAIKASIETAIAEGIFLEPHCVPETGTMGTTISLNEPLLSDTTSEETFYETFFNYPSDASPNQETVSSTIFSDTSTNTSGLKLARRDMTDNSSCIVCFDSQVEAACIPCGHMAGCLACLKKIEAKSKKCPVCRAKVDQVIKIYTV